VSGSIRVYIAAPLFTETQRAFIDEVVIALQERRVDYFSPYHNSQAIFQGKPPSECSQDQRDQVISDNITNIDTCDLLFAWVGGMGGFTDPGVVWEMGYACRAHKFILAYVDDTDERKTMNLMLAGTIDAFIHGRHDLEAAMDLMRYGKIQAFRTLAQQFDPSWALKKDREPVI
jgi:nucleoside 2-deoxyribosyltransferase